MTPLDITEAAAVQFPMVFKALLSAHLPGWRRYDVRRAKGSPDA